MSEYRTLMLSYCHLLLLALAQPLLLSSSLLLCSSHSLLPLLLLRWHADRQQQAVQPFC